MKQFSKIAGDQNIGKKDKDKRSIKNWRTISVLNTDMKITSKDLVTGLKNVLHF